VINVSIIGLGLIGGSLGLALRESPINVVVSGWDRDPGAIVGALTSGAIERPAITLAEAVAEADVVVVATPVMVVQSILPAIAPYLKAGAVVTDVASTKAQLMAWAEEALPSNVSLIGGHPMAGSEQHGIYHARANLFHNAVYCLTPHEQATPEALALLEKLVVAIGARPLLMPAATHDAYVAAVSHLPFLLSIALTQLTATDDQWSIMSMVAATGYRDLTRLASGDPVMHRDICLTNAEAIRPWLHNMADFLSRLAEQLDDPEALQALFDSAKQHRNEWLRNRDNRDGLAPLPPIAVEHALDVTNGPEC
jgi:prephenate dehydrogenase